MFRSSSLRDMTLAWSSLSASCVAGRVAERDGIGGKRTISVFMPVKNSCGMVAFLPSEDGRILGTFGFIVSD